LIFRLDVKPEQKSRYADNLEVIKAIIAGETTE
jgi:hypothetical protein